MKTEIIIKDGNVKIVLKPESEFETDLIEKIQDSKAGYTNTTEISTEERMGFHHEHKIEIKLFEKLQ